MKKRKILKWTLWISHCIDLMLKYFENKTLIYQDTILKDGENY